MIHQNSWKKTSAFLKTLSRHSKRTSGNTGLFGMPYLINVKRLTWVCGHVNPILELSESMLLFKKKKTKTWKAPSVYYQVECSFSPPNLEVFLFSGLSTHFQACFVKPQALWFYHCEYNFFQGHLFMKIWISPWEYELSAAHKATIEYSIASSHLSTEVKGQEIIRTCQLAYRSDGNRSQLSPH